MLSVGKHNTPNTKVTISIAQLANLMAQAQFCHAEVGEVEFQEAMTAWLKFLCSDPIQVPEVSVMR